MTRYLLRAALSSLAVSIAAQSPAADLHAFWDQRCRECHGHAAAFARRFLTVEDGRLAGRHHRADLAAFLDQHEGAREHSTAIRAMLLAQVETPPLFKSKCSGCHGTAAAFARKSLAKDASGALVGRETKKPVAEFLKSHGRLSADEVPMVVDALARVLGEIDGTPRPQ